MEHAYQRILNKMDSTNSTVFSITFPREPAEETPCIALCGMCSRRLPHAPTDHQDVPIQLPCGCVLHFACIQFWFEAQASDTNVNGTVFQLSCWNCNRMFDHGRVDNRPGVNEVFLSFAWDETCEVMNLAIALILPASECETVDPRETTFGNPGHGHPE